MAYGKGQSGRKSHRPAWMLRFVSRFACLAVLLLPDVAPAGELRHSQPNASPPRNERSAAIADASVPQSADVPPHVPAAERTRYHFRNGHWWYWGKTEAWSYWTGSRWVAYSPDAYVRWYREWRLAKDKAELARLKSLIRSMETTPRRRSPWIRDPDSYLPFTNSRGGFR